MLEIVGIVAIIATLGLDCIMLLWIIPMKPKTKKEGVMLILLGLLAVFFLSGHYVLYATKNMVSIFIMSALNVIVWILFIMVNAIRLKKLIDQEKKDK